MSGPRDGAAAHRAVAFDVGNVLLDWLPERLVEPISAASGLAGDVAMECVGRLYSREKRRLDLGDLAPAEFHSELNRMLAAAGGRELPYDRLLEIWCGTLRPRPGANALARRVRRGLAVAVWSNTDPVHFAHYSSWFPFFASARSLWLSFAVGVAKPDRAYYEGALAAIGARPDEVFFVDDAAANVEAARALGIDAVQAATLEDVERELARRGLID